MSLNIYLIRAGRVTGPIAKNTSNSAIEVIKKELLGQPQFVGGEAFLTFGNAVHAMHLEKSKSYNKKLSEADKTAAMACVDSLGKHPVVKKLMQEAICEKKMYTVLNGVEFAYILDIHQPKRSTGSDIKTTTCKSLIEFIDSAKKYGYFRQGKLYKIAARLKHFYFVAIQKEPPYNVYILDVSEYPEEELYAERELEFLIYFYKKYGKTII